MGGEGTGCWVIWCLWELCCWGLYSCNSRDPTPEKPGGYRITLFSVPLTPHLVWGNSAGKESIVRLVAPASTALLWRVVGRVGWGGSSQV